MFNVDFFIRKYVVAINKTYIHTESLQNQKQNIENLNQYMVTNRMNLYPCVTRVLSKYAKIRIIYYHYIFL